MSNHTTKDPRGGTYPTFGLGGPAATGATTGRGGFAHDSSNQPAIVSDNGTNTLTTTDSVVTVPTSITLAVTTADKLTVGGVIAPQHIEVVYSMNANASLADQAFFIANRAYQVTAIQEVHATAGTAGGSVNLQVTKDTSTDAPGAGTDLLTNNTNAGFDLKGVANTVQVGTLTGTAASLQLAAGDRLSVDFAGTLTTLAGVVVTVSLKRI